jgi:hypothetical protein
VVKGPKEYHIKKRQERSTEFETWIRLLDKKREEDARRDPSRRWRERLRIVPGDQKNSEFLVLPTGMPVDYFDPLFFNGLQPRLRHSLTTGKVALLPDISQSFSGHPDERISDAKFTEKYEDSVLVKYDLVDEGELDGPDDDDWMITENEDELGAYDDDLFDEDMAEKRQELVTQLS